ncbi:MAG TPA: hypothetical protein VMB72_04520 [Acidimicrobiales bacterium]|nr:hypothetical protein [Acidimicrobiales bacterium]
MGFRARHRIAGWTFDLRRWARDEEARHGDKTTEGQYAFGVFMAALERIDRVPWPPGTMDRYWPPAQCGFRDATALIEQVVATGVAPGRNFGELLPARGHDA